MSEPKKVSLNQETATDTEKHNDRTMYRRGYDERANNVHWDMYGCGSSFEAEARYYDETFGAVLQAQNERAIEMRKYERVMDMPTWHSKHMPKEAVVQLGCVGNNDDVKDYAIEAAKKMKERIESLGGVVISYDVHDDEYTEDEETGELIKGTPHAHIRYLFLVDDKNGMPKIDMKNALLQAGVEPPDPSKKVGRNNNPSQTFLDGCRDMLEDYADEYEVARSNPKVDRSRTSRPHQTVAVYKARKQAEAALERAAAAEAREAEAVARVEAMQQTLDDAIADRDAAIAAKNMAVKERDAAVTERDAAIGERKTAIEERDAAKEERDKWDRSRELIMGKSFKRGGKSMLGIAGLEERRGELQDEVDGMEAKGAAMKADIAGLEESYTSIVHQTREAADKRVDASDVLEYIDETYGMGNPKGQDNFDRMLSKPDEYGQTPEDAVSESFGGKVGRVVKMALRKMFLRVLANIVKEQQLAVERTHEANAEWEQRKLDIHVRQDEPEQQGRLGRREAAGSMHRGHDDAVPDFSRSSGGRGYDGPSL